MSTARLLLATTLLAAVAAGAAYAADPAYWRGQFANLQSAIATGQSSSGPPAQPATPKAAPPAAAGAPRPVRAVTPQPSTAAVSLALTGRTAPIEQAQIAARATGYVAERRVDIGDKVDAGDLLLTIDAPEIGHQIARAKAAVDQATARRQLAAANADRSDSLVQSGAVSKQLRDERRANELTAEADVAAAMAEVRRLEEVRNYLTVRAPFGGTVVARQVERGDRVTAGETTGGSMLFRIARLDELRIEVDVPQSSVLKVDVGNPAKVGFAELPGQTFEAKVARLTRLVEASSATMRVELTMANPGERIPAGLVGQVQLQLTRPADTVTVPTNTLTVRGGQQTVAVVDAQSTVRFRRITLGRDLGNRVEVLAGLTAADRVILSPNALMRDGDKVDVTLVAPTT